MSASGRLNSVAATLAAMVHEAKVYYTVADRYSQNEKERKIHGISICEKSEIRYLENFKIELPDERGQKVLAYLCLKPNGLKTDEIIDLLHKEGFEPFTHQYENLKKREKMQRHLINLNRGILDKLEKSGYVTRERVGRRNTIKITKSGEYIAHISGLLHK
jgi:hypothetical protein